jgi:glycine cleavage system H protein
MAAASSFARRGFSTWYAESDEYLRIKDDKVHAFVGISNWAQEQLGDVVYVDLPEEGAEVSKGDSFGSIESVKSASDVYMPVDGEIVSVNSTLADQAELVNEDAEGAGFMVEIKMSDPSQAEALLDAEAYKKKCDEAAEE